MKMQNKEHLTSTEIGDILTDSIIHLQTVDVPGGSMIVALDNLGKNWNFFYEQGSDYQAFLDSHKNDIELLEEWMPDALQNAIDEFNGIFKGNNYATSGLDWYQDWVNEAKLTIKNLKNKREKYNV